MLADKLNKATGSNLTHEHMEHWFEGGKHYNKADRVVKKYLGRGLYHEALARLDNVLHAKLHGKNKAKIGGIEFHNLQHNRHLFEGQKKK